MYSFVLGADSTEVLKKLQNQFPPGIISPYTLIIEASNGDDLLSDNYFKALETVQTGLESMSVTICFFFCNSFS